RAIRCLATAAMDVSDGLMTDLGKLCAASRCGAELELNLLPASAALNAIYGEQAAQRHALFGGDDYELLFTVPCAKLGQLLDASNALQVPCTQIGQITAGRDVQCLSAGKPVVVQGAGFDHFSA